ncbi:MAG: hypothetical protein UHO63_05095 [Blautia sp.]|nr:hypothetical protein [Blautia sp.]
MDKKELQTLLEQVASGKIKPEEAMLQIKTEPYNDMGFAKLDTHRGIRQGMSGILGIGSSSEHCVNTGFQDRQMVRKIMGTSRCFFAHWQKLYPLPSGRFRSRRIRCTAGEKACFASSMQEQRIFRDESFL